MEKVVVCRDKGCHAHAPLERARTIAVALEQEVALKDRQLGMAREALNDMWAEKDEDETALSVVPPTSLLRRSWWRFNTWRRRGWQDAGYSTDHMEPDDDQIAEGEVLCGSLRRGHECSRPTGHNGDHACKERWVEYNTPDNLLRTER